MKTAFTLAIVCILNESPNERDCRDWMTPICRTPVQTSATVRPRWEERKETRLPRKIICERNDVSR